MDQEKYQPGPSHIEHKQHNASPFQKTAMPRWRVRSKEKGTVVLACTWIVDHQISKHCIEMIWREQY